MTIMRRLAVPSFATIALVAGVGFAVAQSGGAGSAGGAGGGGAGSGTGVESPSNTSVSGTPAKVTKSKRGYKTTKRAKRQSMPTKGRPLGPTNTGS